MRPKVHELGLTGVAAHVVLYSRCGPDGLVWLTFTLNKKKIVSVINAKGGLKAKRKCRFGECPMDNNTSLYRAFLVQ